MPKSGGLYYSSYSQQAENLPVLILLHGAGGSAAVWPYQLRRLPGWRVLAVDLPGHGSSSTPAQPSIEKYAASLWAWADEMGVQNAVLCGHSMGAAIAMRMALAEPLRARSLFLLGAAANFPVNPQLMEKFASPVRVQDGVRNMVKWSFTRGATELLRTAYSRQLLANPPGLLYADFAACARFELGDAARDLALPTLVLCGAEDLMVPPHLSVALVQSLPYASLHSIPKAGHMLMLEQPGLVTAAIEGTLRSRKQD